MVNDDRVEQTISLCASRDRVWRALTDAGQFATWFGIAFDADAVFVAGAQLVGRIAPTRVDPGVARTQKAYFGMRLDFSVVRVEPVRQLALRWHSFAWEAGIDCASEPTTLVVFELRQVASRTNLTITESGFGRIPIARRAVAMAASTRRWARQAYLIEKFLFDVRDRYKKGEPTEVVLDQDTFPRSSGALFETRKKNVRHSVVQTFDSPRRSGQGIINVEKRRGIMSEFIYLYREAHMASPQEMEARMPKWFAWFKDLEQKGHLVNLGHPLNRTDGGVVRDNLGDHPKPAIQDHLKTGHMK